MVEGKYVVMKVSKTRTITQNYSNTVLLVFVNTGLLIQTKNGLLYTIWNMGILTNTHSQIRLT